MEKKPSSIHRISRHISRYLFKVSLSLIAMAFLEAVPSASSLLREVVRAQEEIPGSLLLTTVSEAPTLQAAEGLSQLLLRLALDATVIAPVLLCGLICLVWIVHGNPVERGIMAGRSTRGRGGKTHAFTPEPFDGHNLKVDKWLHQFDVISDLNNWDDSTQMKFLTESLKGEALDVYTKLSPEAKGNCQAVKDALIEAFHSGTEHRQPHGPKEIVFANSMGKGYYLKGKIEGIPVRFLVDSGAQVSVVHPDLWEQATDGDLDTLRPFENVVKVANGAEMKILGIWDTTVTLGKLEMEAEFLVANASTEEAIIGTDVLQDHGAILDFKHRTCTLRGKKFRLLPVGGSLEEEFDLELIEEISDN
ncbi:retroviral-like aspartic protease 1 [Antechinus flavipes]|uniref:retroviral-like aspartic protease 1 n=1 Tax=Antechinus flavipes TaxID=38775 RepID=UPI002236945E|nr:retroviral-like aspartic protease 1 [Antechinus flavipes]